VGSIVRRNFVSFTGLSTLGADVNAEAIWVRGAGSRIVVQQRPDPQHPLFQNGMGFLTVNNQINHKA